MTKKAIEERAHEFYNAVFDKELQHLMDVAEGRKHPNKYELEQYELDGCGDPEDAAREEIEGHGYGISKEMVYYVTLAGGGPAARLKVTLDDDGDIEDASLQFQDWFEPWTDAPHQDPDLVARYADLLGVRYASEL